MPTSPLLDLSGLVFLRRDALARGYSDHQIAGRVRAGEWARVRRGAYVAGQVWDSLGAADRARLCSRAVLATAHPNAVLSHVSAALEWGAPVWGLGLEEVHTTRTDDGAGRREAGVVHHRGVLPLDEVMTQNGVPVTSPTRCAFEVATLGTVEQALVTVNGLMGTRLIEPEKFAALCHERRYWPSSLNAHLVCRLADPRLESVGETRTAYFLWEHRFPQPVPQHEIRDQDGRLIGRVDFAFPDHGVFVEFDGTIKYRMFRRPGESLEQFLLHEKRREERICQLTGWLCFRLGWADLERRDETAARLRMVFARVRA
ncbi:type IV toxin-antitoxin system AbiEi family antitoxin domain-containing protein [Nocardioides solisilvae]|uniref:type IV toxin-antitoxin system AbiEi family antitoxin domain-containing protein n=1 Tax=Nocardioides solisilvae TaxID=1542435 RepID=UPI000D74F008|nr:type IV toxin-antitoxin system AbiEi family antitoxin domain-containing protein [Nocardioides solisilvae]